MHFMRMHSVAHLKRFDTKSSKFSISQFQGLSELSSNTEEFNEINIFMSDRNKSLVLKTCFLRFEFIFKMNTNSLINLNTND